jgi:predicted HTH domain antitoxin
MDSMGIRALRENPGQLTKNAQAGKCTLLNNRNKVLAITIPFDQTLIEQGLKVKLAAALFSEQIITLVNAAKIAELPVETFIEKLGIMGIPVINQTPEELEKDLQNLG